MNRYIATIQRLLLDRPERRRAHRYAAVTNRASLAWKDGEETRQAPSRLLDISLSGTLVDADQPLPTEGPVWVRLEAPRTTEWAAARVVRNSRSRKVGLQFADCCPYELFKAATHGNNLGGMSALGSKAPSFDCLSSR